MRSTLRPRWLLALTCLLASGALACDFFNELEPLEDGDETGTAGDGTGMETGEETGGDDAGAGEGCTLVDDRCASQDVVESCDLGTGALSTLDCAALCSGKLNFTCLQASTGQHGCWCVTPGDIALDGCAELEACVTSCATTACTDACFGRASVPTVRLLGALYHCAENDCEDLCNESPENCNSCILATRAGVYGGCGVERSVCDADEVEDFPWP